MRGVILECRKRARAIHFSDGAFERIEPGHFDMLRRPRQQQLPPPQFLPQSDDTAAASAIYLAIQSTPSEAKSLLLELDAQAAVEETEVHAETSELPFQDRKQISEPQKQLLQQQFDQDIALQTVTSINMRKQPLPANTNDHDSVSTIQIVLQKITDLDKQFYRQNDIATTTQEAPNTFMQVKISTPSMSSTNKLIIVDELQGPNDPFKAALGHDELNDRMHTLACEVINIGKWPKLQILAGRATDVSNVVQATIKRISKDNNNDACNTINGQQIVLDVVKEQAVTGSNSAAMQASPISVSSQGSNGAEK